MGMEKIKLTAIVKTQNSEKTICETLEALSFVDEVIAIDSHSKDDTIDFLKEYKVKIIYSTKGEFKKSFDEAVSVAQNDWILALDDDEIIPKKTLENIEKYILKEDKKKRNAISLDRKVFYLNKELKCVQKRKVIKVFKKGFIEQISNFETDLKAKNSKVCYLKKEAVLKYDKSSIVDKIQKIIEKNIINLKLKKSLNNSIFIKPFFKFLYLYFLKGAIFEGKRGLIYSINLFIEKYIFEMMKFEKSKKGENDDI